MRLGAFIVGYFLLVVAIVVPVLWVPLGLAGVAVVRRRKASRAGQDAARLAALDAARWREIERSL